MKADPAGSKEYFEASTDWFNHSSPSYLTSDIPELCILSFSFLLLLPNVDSRVELSPLLTHGLHYRMIIPIVKGVISLIGGAFVLGERELLQTYV